MCLRAPVRLFVLLLALGCWLAAGQPVRADSFLPPAGKVWMGVAGGDSIDPYAQQTGAHPAVYQAFVTWGQQNDWFFAAAQRAHARLMFHLSTNQGQGTPEAIDSAAIASGRGDAYLLWLNGEIARRAQPVYLRLMAEMDGYNAYDAFNPDGSSRGPGHSTRAFVAAWRRIALIVRGGALAQIDARLTALGQPPVRGASDDLPPAPVSLLWVPQVAGAPDIPANAPNAYWPGSAYVDWCGTDFYSAFPNWTGLNAFYADPVCADKPFVFGEWAIWGSDNPGFVHELFAWVRSHPRVRMLAYNQGQRTNGPFRLGQYPLAAAALRGELHSGAFPPFTAEWQSGSGAALNSLRG